MCRYGETYVATRVEEIEHLEARIDLWKDRFESEANAHIVTKNDLDAARQELHQARARIDYLADSTRSGLYEAVPKAPWL